MSQSESDDPVGQNNFGNKILPFQKGNPSKSTVKAGMYNLDQFD